MRVFFNIKNDGDTLRDAGIGGLKRGGKGSGVKERRGVEERGAGKYRGEEELIQQCDGTHLQPARTLALLVYPMSAVCTDTV